MQTTKFLFVIGAATILAAPLQVTAAPDSEAQAKMREALRQKMEELNAPSTPAPAPARAVPAPAAAPAPAKAPAIAPQVTASPDEAAQAKMQEALRQKMQELNPTPVIAPTVVVPVPAEPVQTPTAPIKPRTVEQRFSEVPAADDDAKAARMREALRQKIAGEQAAPTPAPVVSTPAKPTPTVTSSAVVAAPITPEFAPAPEPGPASKQARLATLLQLYKADSITPQQYHTQRAKIIAEP